jgi:putative nucleotidyltransferase with HDIG domain
MTERLLVIDDEPHILAAIERVFVDHDLSVLTASDPRYGLELLSRGDVAVVITDNMMPGISGLEVLRCAKEVSPDTVRIMLTGHASLDTAIAAINLGEVFRFVLKPWDNAILIGIVEEALQRYRIVKQLREGDEGVMLSIAQAIELKDPYTRGHCDRVAEYALLMAREINVPESQLSDIRHGSWLHDCGKIGVSEMILNKPSHLDEDDYDTVKKHCLWGAELARLANLPRAVANIILYHHERYDGNGYPTGLAGEAIPLEARMVAVADVFDALTSRRPYRAPFSADEALDIIDSVAGTQLDPHYVAIFREKMQTFPLLYVEPDVPVAPDQDQGKP